MKRDKKVKKVEFSSSAWSPPDYESDAYSKATNFAMFVSAAEPLYKYATGKTFLDEINNFLKHFK